MLGVIWFITKNEDKIILGGDGFNSLYPMLKMLKGEKGEKDE